MNTQLPVSSLPNHRGTGDATFLNKPKNRGSPVRRFPCGDWATLAQPKYGGIDLFVNPSPVTCFVFCLALDA